MVDAKALVVLGTEPRCKTQLRVSAKVWRTELEPTLGLSLEIKQTWLQNLSNSEGGPGEADVHHGQVLLHSRHVTHGPSYNPQNKSIGQDFCSFFAEDQ